VPDTNLKQQQRINPEAEELVQEIMAMERGRCRPLCEAMQQYLPRELRDIVYENVVGPAEWHKNNHAVPLLESGSPAVPEMALTGSMQNFWCILEYQDFIGGKTRQELAECWYKTCTFDFTADVHLIEAFLRADAAVSRPLALGRPVLDLVRRLEIALSCAVLLDEANSEQTFTRILQDLALLQRPARPQMILDTVFDSSRLQRLRIRNLFERLAQRLPSFTD
jgi:hypothetical protein